MTAGYVIGPALMGGLVKEAGQAWIKVHLHGRLGVIAVPKSLALTEEELLPGHEVQFFFSYLEVDDFPRDYDLTELQGLREVAPVPVGGVLTEVNDTAVKCEMPGGTGTVAVPRRWVFTNQTLAVGQTAGFYFSPMRLVGKRDIPAAIHQQA